MYEEKNMEKNSEFQMGIEHMTFQTLVRCSNHSATGNFSDEQVNNYYFGLTKWLHCTVK